MPPTTILNASEVLLEAQRQLRRLPGARMLAHTGGFYAIVCSSLRRSHPSVHDSYVFYPELSVFSGADGSLCVVGYGQTFNGRGQALGGGSLIAMPFAPEPLVPDSALSAHITRGLNDGRAYPGLLEHAGTECPIHVHPKHAWNILGCDDLLQAPLREHRTRIADDAVGYAPAAAGAIYEVLRAFIANSHA